VWTRVLVWERVCARKKVESDIEREREREREKERKIQCESTCVLQCFYGKVCVCVCELA